jgi:hypothetical protein
MDDIHILKAGLSVTVKWRSAEPGTPLFNNLKRLKLIPTFNGGDDISCWVTFVDHSGVSVKLLRGPELGGNIDGYMPKGHTNWQSYFEPLRQVNAGYADNKHFKQKFPTDFL